LRLPVFFNIVFFSPFASIHFYLHLLLFLCLCMSIYSSC
jgi:hypothetical protein